MRATEFLQSLISLLDTIESEEDTTEQPPIIINQPPVIVNVNSDNSDDSNDSHIEDKSEEEIVPDNTGMFIPPIQQNIEVMKKNAGIKSVYDNPANKPTGL